jgi:hypothetical protein
MHTTNSAFKLKRSIKRLIATVDQNNSQVKRAWIEGQRLNSQKSRGFRADFKSVD